MSFSAKDTKVESKKSKTLRIILAILYFVEVLLTTFPFMWGADASGNIQRLTAFEMIIQPSGYNGAEDVKLALIFGVLLLLPVVCFFFCILDKSMIKNFVSVASCLVCSGIITFGIGAMIDMGALVALLLYILILFLSTTSMITAVKK